MNILKRIFNILFTVAEVDGIAFYSYEALNNYLKNKSRKEMGMHLYSYRAMGERSVSICKSILESNNVFDYKCNRLPQWRDVYDIEYYSDRQLIKNKNG